MSQLRFIQILFLVGILAVSHASEPRTVALSALLAPVQAVAQKKDLEPSKEEAAVEKKVIHGYHVIKLNDVLSQMEKELEGEIKESSKLSLSSRFNWGSVKVRDDRDWGVRLTAPFTPSRNGRWYPSFELLVDGAVLSEYRIPIQVALFKPVWAVDQNANRGAAVTEVSLIPIVRDIFEERVMPIDADEPLEHYEFSRSVSRGRLITWDDLEERPQVRKNAIVDVEFSKGALQVKMRGRAMDSGMMGDLVTIRNLDTSREFIASVSGENLVEFEL